MCHVRLTQSSPKSLHDLAHLPTGRPLYYRGLSDLPQLALALSFELLYTPLPFQTGSPPSISTIRDDRPQSYDWAGPVGAGPETPWITSEPVECVYRYRSAAES